MEQEKLIDVMYEEMAEKIKVPDELKVISEQKYDEIENELRNSIENEEIVSDILEKLDDFIDALNNEEEYRNKMSYRGGFSHSNELKKDLTIVNVNTNNEIEDEFFNKMYEEDAESIAVLTEEDKMINNLRMKMIVFSNISAKLNKKEIKNIEKQLQEYTNGIYLECAHLCRKNYKYAFKKCFNLRLACSDNT